VLSSTHSPPSPHPEQRDPPCHPSQRHTAIARPSPAGNAPGPCGELRGVTPRCRQGLAGWVCEQEPTAFPALPPSLAIARASRRGTAGGCSPRPPRRSGPGPGPPWTCPAGHLCGCCLAPPDPWHSPARSRHGARCSSRRAAMLPLAPPHWF